MTVKRRAKVTMCVCPAHLNRLLVQIRRNCPAQSFRGRDRAAPPQSVRDATAACGQQVFAAASRRAMEPRAWPSFEATECHRAIASWWLWVRLSLACLRIVVAAFHLLEGPAPSGQLSKHLVEGEHTSLVRIRVLLIASEPMLGQPLHNAHRNSVQQFVKCFFAQGSGGTARLVRRSSPQCRSKVLSCCLF